MTSLESRSGCFFVAEGGGVLISEFEQLGEDSQKERTHGGQAGHYDAHVDFEAAEPGDYDVFPCAAGGVVSTRYSMVSR